jgi:hypothetical protein
MPSSKRIVPILALSFAILVGSFSLAQQPPKLAAPTPPPPSRPQTPNDTLVSPEVLSDKQVTFRLYASDAKTVDGHAHLDQLERLPAPVRPPAVPVTAYFRLTIDGSW